MKGNGVNRSIDFVLIENSPILSVKGNKVEETEFKLLKGTVVKGNLKTKILKVGDQKRPFKLIELNNKKGFISPRVVNLYVGDFANLDGLNINKNNTPVQNSALGEKRSGKKKAKDFVINYGLPIAGGVIGYKIAKKAGADQKKMIGYVVFFGLLGLIPRYIYKNK